MITAPYRAPRRAPRHPPAYKSTSARWFGSQRECAGHRALSPDVPSGSPGRRRPSGARRGRRRIAARWSTRRAWRVRMQCGFSKFLIRSVPTVPTGPNRENAWKKSHLARWSINNSAHSIGSTSSKPGPGLPPSRACVRSARADESRRHDGCASHPTVWYQGHRRARGLRPCENGSTNVRTRRAARSQRRTRLAHSVTAGRVNE